jgi:Lipocalin-like domain
MNRLLGKLVAMAAWVLLGVALSTFTASAQGANDVVGTWTLVSSIAEKDGKKTDQFGPGAKGMMILDVEGRFMLTIIGAELPKFASNNRATGTPEENKAVVGKSIALFGTYSMAPADKTIILKIENSTFPNWDATEQKRSVVTLSGDELEYMTAQASGGGTATVTWKRTK